VAEAKEPDAAVRGLVDGSGGAGKGRRGEWSSEWKRVSCTTMGIYTSRMPQKR